MNISKAKYIVVNLRMFISIFVASCIVVCSVIMCHKAASQRYHTTSAGVNNTFTVIIDAGHGGMDGGTQSEDGVLEKDVNLEISKALQSVLELYGYRTLMTRVDDNVQYDKGADTIREKKVSDIHNRMAMIESEANAVFISIHQNHFSQSQYNGAQVFYSSNHNDSKLLAQRIQDSFKSNLQPENNREIKKSGTEIYLLYHSQIPSVMVECGFMSNPNEAKLLADKDYQKKLALVIANGIMNYLGTETEVKINGS